MQQVFVHLAHAKRDRDQRIDVPPARLQQQHARLRVLAEAMREHTSRGTCTHDHIVEASIRHHVFFLLLLSRGAIREWPHRAIALRFMSAKLDCTRAYC
jgi:hypothetical protein